MDHVSRLSVCLPRALGREREREGGGHFVQNSVYWSRIHINVQTWGNTQYTTYMYMYVYIVVAVLYGHTAILVEVC